MRYLHKFPPFLSENAHELLHIASCCERWWKLERAHPSAWLTYFLSFKSQLSGDFTTRRSFKQLYSYTILTIITISFKCKPLRVFWLPVETSCRCNRLKTVTGRRSGMLDICSSNELMQELTWQIQLQHRQAAAVVSALARATFV